jgi:hypothetical protein
MKAALLALCVTYPAWSASTTLALEPAADTFISLEDPAKNFGAAAKLEAAYNQRTPLIRFDLSRVPASAVVASARLTVASDQAVAFTVCDLDKEFSETEATYRQAAQKQPWASPGLMRYRDYGAGSLFYCSAPMRSQGPGPASADLSTFVRMAIYTHRKTVNFALLAARDSASNASIASRRAPDAATRPKLEIVFDPSAPKAVTNYPFLEEKFAPVTVDASQSARPDGSSKGLLYLWTVDRPAPGSTNSSGQELGLDIKLKFEPDVPGFWNLRLRVTDPATKEFSETTVAVNDLLLRPHPRLGFNDELLNQIKVLQAGKKPVWTRFEDWLNKPGAQGEGLLLGYAVTRKNAYFNSAWKLYYDRIYVTAKEHFPSVRPFFGPCGQAVYCDEHLAATDGAALIAQMAKLYDWCFDALSPGQRGDLIVWLNAATQYIFEGNSYMHSHVSGEGALMTTAIAASAYATYDENRLASIQLAWFRQEWNHSLETLDLIGRGGAAGEGNTSLIDLANFVYYASGENLFLSHPYFRRRLAFEAFSGRGSRANGLALTRRFPNSEETDLWNWAFRQKDKDEGQDPWVELFFYVPPPDLVKPKRLSFFDPSLGHVYARSDWNGPGARTVSSAGKTSGFADNGQAVVWVADHRKFAYLREADVLLIADTDARSIHATDAHDVTVKFTKFDTSDTFGANVTAAGKTYKVTFTKATPDAPVIDGTDLQAPVISNAKPASQLPSGTRQTAVSVTTNEPSSCRFSYRPDTPFPSMTGAFQTANGLTHTVINRDLNNGDTYTYFVRCMDKSGNEDLEDVRLTFSVAH